MQVLVVGSQTSTRVQQLEAGLRAEGCRAHFFSLQQVTLPVIDDDVWSGMVIFEECAHSPLEVLARARELTRYLNMPAIVIGQGQSVECMTGLEALGVSAVCGPDADAATILKAVRAHATSLPIVGEVHDRLIAPFIEATVMTMREMAGVEAIKRSVYKKTGYQMFGDVSAVLELLGKCEGSLVINFPQTTAVRLVKRSLGDEAHEPDAGLICDCVGEICNVIAGQARRLMSGTAYEFSLSTPKVFSGTTHEIAHKAGAPCMVAAFSCELGEFSLQLCLSERA